MVKCGGGTVTQSLQTMQNAPRRRSLCWSFSVLVGCNLPPRLSLFVGIQLHFLVCHEFASRGGSCPCAELQKTEGGLGAYFVGRLPQTAAAGNSLGWCIRGSTYNKHRQHLLHSLSLVALSGTTVKWTSRIFNAMALLVARPLSRGALAKDLANKQSSDGEVS